MGILLLVGLLTFFFPLVTFQVPALGNQSLTGYDILSKTQELNARLSSATKGSAEAGTELWETSSQPSIAVGSDPQLPASVQFAALVPLEAAFGIACVVLALPGCFFLSFKSGYVKVVSIAGSIASVIAVLHLAIINSDLHTWLQRTMRAGAWDSSNNSSFSGFAQQLGNLIASSFQVRPGAGLYVLAAVLVLVAFLSYSRVLGGTQVVEPPSGGEIKVPPR